MMAAKDLYGITDPDGQDYEIPTASTTQKGLVKTSGNITNTDGTIDVRSASTSQTGVVQLSNTYNGTSQTKAVTEKALSDGLSTKQASGSYKTVQTAVNSPTASGTDISFIDTISQNTNGVITATRKTVRSASTSQTGVVKLNNAVNSTSTSEAATANAVKTAYDKANSPTVSVSISDGKISVTVNGTTSTAVVLPSVTSVDYATRATYLVKNASSTSVAAGASDDSGNIFASTLTLS